MGYYCDYIGIIIENHMGYEWNPILEECSGQGGASEMLVGL
jgi:hypothetical protein